MATPGMLERVLIRAYDDPTYQKRWIDEFSAYVNPSEITLAYELEYNSAQGAGTTGSRMDFNKAKPGDLALSFFLDGTGANGRRIDVQKAIEDFQRVTGYNGGIHRTHYLMVMWGTLQVKRCVLKSASIAYKLFEPNGIALRAVISANFTDNSDDKTRVAQAQDSSPDLTHVRLVKAGDTLPRLCAEIYGDPHLYLAVATANGMNGFRGLTPGTRVFFPPLRK